ncbi:hypothetical protein [Bacillus sp. KH172YL63]|uniref:hypothetical protein n=1 Tax=Bacillus sp. KH172YL63 TaxID=2709784 RepID=UPI0013E4525A|nr:hypothetical protein [Bacillus sp. KH172YL63]BCB03435.1 hypothetical protein KH172YL63_15680 [Bacillus sp. KH172YL63]
MKQLSSIQLQQQIIHYKSEMERYKQRCAALESNVVVRKYGALQKEHQALLKKLEEYEDVIVKKGEEIEGQSLKFVFLHKAQEKEMSKLRFTINQLKDQLRKINQHYMRDTKLYDEQLHESAEVFQQEVLSLQTTISHLLFERERYFSANEEMGQRLQQREWEMWVLEEQIKSCEDEAHSKEHVLRRSIELQNIEIEALVKEKEDLIDQFNHKEAEMAGLLQRLTDEENKHNEATLLQQKLKDRNRALHHALKKQREDMEMYMKTLQSVSLNIKQMKEDDSLFKVEEKNTASPEMKKLENTIAHLQFTNSLLIEEINKLKNKPGS